MRTTITYVLVSEHDIDLSSILDAAQAAIGEMPLEHYQAMRTAIRRVLECEAEMRETGHNNDVFRKHGGDPDTQCLDDWACDVLAIALRGPP